MELVGVFKMLWARRLLVGVGAVVAIAVGMLAIRALSAHSAATWAASSRVLVDTTNSQLASAVPAGVDTLPMRAFVIASLMATEKRRTLIAREAGLQKNKLDVLGPSSRAAPEVLTPLVTKTAPFGAAAPDPYVLSLYADGETPIISIEANAPDAAHAARLASAGVITLNAFLASQQAGERHVFVIRTLGSLRTTVVPSHAGRRLLAVIGALFIFIVWCAGIIVASGIARALRRPRPLSAPTAVGS